MDLQSLSKQHLEDAISKGYIHLTNGDIRELSSAQILAVAKFIYKEGIYSESESVKITAPNSPVEMFYTHEKNLEEDLISLDLDTELLASENYVQDPSSGDIFAIAEWEDKPVNESLKESEKLSIFNSIQKENKNENNSL